MFENLRDAFRDAVDNFNKELGRDDIPDEGQIKKAIQLSEMEEKEATTCRRREDMARRIDDEETAKVAAEYAEKHEKRREIQARKALEKISWRSSATRTRLRPHGAPRRKKWRTPVSGS
jgi:hypothetical protein